MVTDITREHVHYDVLGDAVLARIGGTLVGTSSLDLDGTVTVVVSPPWRRRGIGRSLLVTTAGLARHHGLESITLVGPADEATDGDEVSATTAMLASMGLRGLIRMTGGILSIRVSLREIHPVAPNGEVRLPA